MNPGLLMTYLNAPQYPIYDIELRQRNILVYNLLGLLLTRIFFNEHMDINKKREADLFVLCWQTPFTHHYAFIRFKILSVNVIWRFKLELEQEEKYREIKQIYVQRPLQWCMLSAVVGATWKDITYADSYISERYL